MSVNYLLFCGIATLGIIFTKCELNKPDVDTFKRLLHLKRLEQLDAVKKITKLEKNKQLDMVETVTKTIFEVILKSRTVLEHNGFTPGFSDFPESEYVRDAMSLVIENTALLSEIILRIPEVAEKVLGSNSEWKQLLIWSLSFANQTQLLDTSTSKLIYLVSQELNITERSLDYVNPYRKEVTTHQGNKEEKSEDKKKKKKEIQRGPRLTLPKTEL